MIVRILTFYEEFANYHVVLKISQLRYKFLNIYLTHR